MKAFDVRKEVVTLIELMVIQCGTAYCVVTNVVIVGSIQSRCPNKIPHTKRRDSDTFEQTRSHPRKTENGDIVATLGNMRDLVLGTAMDHKHNVRVEIL